MWLSFVGVTMLGYNEKEVGHWTFNKWKKLYDYFKKFHNFKVQEKLFEIENDSTEDVEENYESYEWFTD